MPAPKKNALSEITKRFGITAREARDIATAVGTLGKAVTTLPGKGLSTKKAVKNLGRQVSEAKTAAVKGKTGTTSMQYKQTAASAKAVKEAKARSAQKGLMGKLTPEMTSVKYEEKKSKKR